MSKAIASDKLPVYCYAELPSTGEIIKVKRGETGYWPTGITDKTAKELNDCINVTPAQAEAMLAGSIFGWDIPAADPDSYDEEGKFKDL